MVFSHGSGRSSSFPRAGIKNVPLSASLKITAEPFFRLRISRMGAGPDIKFRNLTGLRKARWYNGIPKNDHFRRRN